MYRFIEKELLKWKNKEERKPLLILGAHQVGKTYSIKNFGIKNFKNLIYINFESNPKFKEYFIESLEPNKILTYIENHFMVTID
ncbi:MAG: hypothetical protein K0Q49_63 [Haloplasmataceae bacterium]|jgi:predicted AAA+ superfamily ATPase|nr:hypothetical protein [Haloplasmataceae bacterium]